MKRVIITGATGFLGTHLVKRLIKDGIEVHAVIRPLSNTMTLDEVSGEKVIYHIHEKENDLIDIMKTILERGDVDVVYHLAAMVQSNQLMDKVEDIIESNIIFGTSLLEAMRRCNVRNFINTGTYWQHYNDELYNPVNMYAASKQAFEDILKYYIEAGGVKAINLCLFDNYGPQDRRNKLMNLLKKIANTDEMLKMSPGEQKIDLVYVDDVVDAYIKAGSYLVDKKYEFCKKYSVSSNKVVTLKELVKIIEKTIGKPLNIVWGGLPYRSREIMVPYSKGERLPGWSPKISLEEGIKKIFEK